MKRLLSLLLSLASLNAVAQQKPATADPRFNDLDTTMQRVIKNWNVAGFAVAVVEKNKVVYAKGFGYRDVEKKLPVTANTLFPIGSVTKSFTTSLIGQLEAEGKLNIDKPVNAFMPSLRFYNNDMNNSINLKDMMSHRTGLPRHDISWYLFNTNARDSILQRIQYQEPTKTVREAWQYNNFMFTAQGGIVEKLTGKTWEQNVEEKLFKPLGMNTSNTTIPELEESKEPSLGYELDASGKIKKMEYFHINGMAPAGAINSSANEMANYLIAWINGGKFNGKEVIPSQFAQQAITSQMVMGGGLPSKAKPDLHFASYGFGWMLASYKGHYRVEHGGNIDGFSASACFFPTDSIGIVVLSNQNGSAVPSIVRNILSDKLLTLKYTDWNSEMRSNRDKSEEQQKKMEKESKVPKGKVHPTTHPLSDFAGIYSNPGYGTLKIYTKNDSLFASGVKKGMWLKHNNYDIFDIYIHNLNSPIDTANKMQSSIQFQMNTAGDIESFSSVLEAGLKPLVFTKGIEAKAIDSKELQKYTGEYSLNEAAVKVYIKENKTLYVFLPGQPEYELVPLGKDRFSIKALIGYSLQFAVTSDRKVTELVFIQPNGNFAAKKK
ncbi:serine hydrolase [Pedobacter psychroterrae]|uniref:Serine hydrolase n=1 Tax=Pedobacter psychroterrae TaxID=2530453 RepID=A0A4R0NHV1_9SPHI|nr:serine hydrolase [Pedobacter psychroterrae]TCD00172.1 serine hydrolase [Pedobacter psychroterrae]